MIRKEEQVNTVVFYWVKFIHLFDHLCAEETCIEDAESGQGSGYTHRVVEYTKL